MFKEIDEDDIEKYSINKNEIVDKKDLSEIEEEIDLLSIISFLFYF